MTRSRIARGRSTDLGGRSSPILWLRVTAQIFEVHCLTCCGLPEPPGVADRLTYLSLVSFVDDRDAFRPGPYSPLATLGIRSSEGFRRLRVGGHHAVGTGVTAGSIDGGLGAAEVAGEVRPVWAVRHARNTPVDPRSVPTRCRFFAPAYGNRPKRGPGGGHFFRSTHPRLGPVASSPEQTVASSGDSKAVHSQGIRARRRRLPVPAGSAGLRAIEQTSPSHRGGFERVR